jgi:eukaryotic-like serine/threonine-protein kinase
MSEPDSSQPTMETKVAAPSSISPELRADSGSPVADPATIPEQRPAPLPADQIGRYRLLSEIGRGGMGIVFRGRDPDLNHTLAIKVLIDKYRGYADVERRFLEEVQITAQLQHPGVPPVHEVGRLEDGRPFFAMKLVKGRTLAELLKERRDLAEDLPRFLAVCQTLAYAHSRGILHRDIKPSNIMVGAFGEVQVMDWGLAKVLAREGEAPAEEPSTIVSVRAAAAPLSQAGTVVGTPAYMAPEQARAEAHLVDERADVFGLGALLCVLLTGQPPYPGADQKRVYRQATRADLADAFSRLDACGADAELVRLAKSCLAVDREGRPRDAGEVARAVETYQAGVQERLRQAEVEKAQAQIKAREERKRRRLRLGLATAALAVLALVVGSVYRWHRQRVARDLAFNADLGRAVELRDAALWGEAGKTLQQAEDRLDEGGSEEQRRHLERARADLALAFELVRIRLDKAVLVDGQFNLRGVEKAYAEAFRTGGLGAVGEEAEVVAARVRASAVQTHLLAALEDWVATTEDSERRAWLLGVARHADPHPVRDRFRDPKTWSSALAVRRLAQEAEEAEVSPPQLVALAGKLQVLGEDALPLLRQAQARHPQDFWLNFALANALMNRKEPGEAVGFYWAALVIRPRTAAVYNNLGAALKDKGDLKGAIAAYLKAIELDPKYAQAHYNLGNVLRARGDLVGAIACYRKAIDCDPKHAGAHTNLGTALEAKNDLAGAIACYREAVAVNPQFDGPQVPRQRPTYPGEGGGGHRLLPGGHQGGPQVP